MSPQPAHRPIGFRPGEIAALLNPGVISQHAEEAAFLWSLRNRAAGEAHYGLQDLAALDRRVEAHLVGLRAAGSMGWTQCLAALERESPGEVFAVGVLAFGTGDRDRMRQALFAGCVSPQLERGLISALGWLSQETVWPWLQLLLGSKAPEHQAIGLAACTLHRHDPGTALTTALRAEDVNLRARALRAAGTLKRHDLLDALREHLIDREPAVAFWAAWACVLLGGRDAVAHLIPFAASAGPFRIRALQLCLRVMPVSDARSWISALASRGESPGLTAVASGILGDPASVPWLIQKMESPVLARLAGEAFSNITGLDLARHDLVLKDAPEAVEPDEVMALDHETNLQWPSAKLVASWWESNHASFRAGHRYLCGKPLDRASATAVLLNGRQRQRAAAALELACADPRQVYVDVRERGDRQHRRLSQWIS
jgi:uncharacterized protein (TIGR02270 family)